MGSLEIVGGGRMGEALVTGLLAGGWSARELTIVEELPNRRRELEQRFGDVGVYDEPVAADGAVVAVKPVDVDRACRAVASAGVHRVLSIAAGVTLAHLEGALPPRTPVVRAMPNTPALVGAGVA
ncbi:MAG: pyrroline-5-carboxylate reductase family protein, partial [Acidimicrobiales bacterium]